MMVAMVSTETFIFWRRISSIINFLKMAQLSRKDGQERCINQRPKQQEKAAVQEQDEPEEEEEEVAVCNTGLH